MRPIKKIIQILKQANSPFELVKIPYQYVMTHNYSIPFKIREALYEKECDYISKKLNFETCSRPSKESIELKESGITLDILNLTSEQVKNLNAKLDRMSPKIIHNSDGEISKKVYSNKELASDIDFLSLATNDKVIRAASDYLGTVPTIEFLAAWQVFEEAKQTNEMYFHMDHHGHRFLKLFFYLSDVELGGGQHEYIPETQNQPKVDQSISKLDNKKQHLGVQIKCKRKHQGAFLINTDVIERYFNNIIRITGCAGSSFMEDTQGLHRGTPIKNHQPRTLFQVTFTASHNYKDTVEPASNAEVYATAKKMSYLTEKQFDKLCSRIFQST